MTRKHRRTPHLDLRRRDLLDDHLRALRAFKLLAARLTRAAGNRGVWCRILRHDVAGRAGVKGIARISGGHARTRRRCSQGRRLERRTDRILVSGPRGHGKAVGRGRHELGFARGHANRAIRVCGISACWRTIDGETNPGRALTLRLLVGRRPHVVIDCTAAERIVARRHVRINWANRVIRVVCRHLVRPRAAAARCVADWPRRPAADPSRPAGRVRSPTALGRRSFLVRKSEKQCVS